MSMVSFRMVVVMVIIISSKLEEEDIMSGRGMGGTRTQNQRVGQWADKVQNGVLPPSAVMGTTVVGCGDHGGVPAAAAASHPQSRDPKILTGYFWQPFQISMSMFFLHVFEEIRSSWK